MIERLEELRSRLNENAVTNDCSRDGCEVSLEGIEEQRLIVDVDVAFPALGRSGKRCDFILFSESEKNVLLVAPIELKSGGVKVGDLLRQLRSGAQFGDELAPNDSSSYCRPVLIHGRRLASWERKKLNEAKIPYRGKNMTIGTARCGEEKNLAKALNIG